MKRLLILALLAVTFALLTASCSSDSDDGTDDATATEPSGATGDITAIAGNSDLAVGPNRFAFALTDNEDQNRPVVEAADTSVRVQLFFGEELKLESDATFVWAIPDVVGFWTANVDLDVAGEWRAEATLTRGGEESVAALPFLVQAESPVPNVGDAAPPTDNLTFASEPNTKRVTTDPDPEPALYEMTVTEALEDGKPFVVVFATPAFCQTRFCGPVVDIVKDVREQFADQVNFIHIEPFELDADGQLVVDEQNLPVAAAPTIAWNLATEPWVFVVGADGAIAKRFEGAASVAELSQALEAVLG